MQEPVPCSVRVIMWPDLQGSKKKKEMEINFKK